MFSKSQCSCTFCLLNFVQLTYSQPHRAEKKPALNIIIIMQHLMRHASVIRLTNGIASFVVDLRVTVLLTLAASNSTRFHQDLKSL